MRCVYGLLISVLSVQFYDAKILQRCRFDRTFYEIHSNIFQLDDDQTSLIVRPLYALTHQSFSTLSMGIIYRLADVYLVPVPLLFQCSQTDQIVTPIDCELTIIDNHFNVSNRTTEPTRTETVPLHFDEYSSLKSISIRGAYFKESIIALRNCRLSTNENFSLSETIFHLRIEFEQTINSSCQNTCIHPELYECSSLSNTCQCRSHETITDTFGRYCIDTELASNCSLTPERCRRICHISDPIHTTHDCQCPLGTQRVFFDNMYHCNLIITECNNSKSLIFCPNGYICQQKQCIPMSTFVHVLSLIILLITALLIIIILIIGLIKMRSIQCIKFIHPHIISIHSSSTTITQLSTHKTYENCIRINFLQ